jgi:hypothetical protein
MHDGSFGRSYQINDDLHLRKVQTYGFLDRVCQQLDLTLTQYEEAKSRYEAVGTWLAEADDPLLSTSVIYAQGSTAIGTNVKPIGSTEHDVDLISLLPDGTPNMEPAVIKRVVGDRLRANGRYRDIMIEKQRCWRINYANEFHLDITPAIPNPGCRNGGELVPDKTLKSWKPSNPKGFRDKFIERAKLMPTLLLEKAQRGVTASDATIEPFPVKSGAKGVLRRTTQVLKRHRDIEFERLDKGLAPLSIIITQLVSQSYEYCIRNFAFDNELDLLVHTIKFMPLFIEKREIGGRTHYFILNETTTGENFAEKWNDQPQRAAAFYRWHRKAEADFARLIETEGLDELTAELKESLGEGLVKRALDAQTGALSAARTAGRLGVAAGVGLTTTAAKATPMPRNTFFGRREE